MGTLGYQLKAFNLPSDTFFGTAVNTVTGTSTPGTPPSGSAYVWYDSGIKKWRVKHSDGTIESLGVGTSGAAAHKDTHKSGGSDPFTKNDPVNCEVRYIEDIADPSSDAQRIWLVNAGSEIRYWDDQSTPIKQTVATTGTAQTFSNKVLNSTCDISGALTQALGNIAFLDVGNKFDYSGTDTVFQRTDSPDALAVYKDSSGVGDSTNISFRLQDAATNTVNYARIDGKIVDSTNGSEDGTFNIYTRIADVLSNVGIFGQNNGVETVLGKSLRLTLSESGLTAARTITFQDSSYKVAAVDINNNFTEKQTIKKDQAVLESLYRLNSTNANQVILEFNLQDSLSNETVYSAIRGEIVSNTDGAEAGKLLVYTTLAGSNRAVVQITENGRLWCGGSNQRIELDETGLTSRRTITFQDSNYKVAGIYRANTFTSGNQVFQVRAEINKEITYTGQISPTQLTADQNDYNPTNFLTSSVVRQDADSSNRLITGLGNATQPSGMRVRIRNISANTFMLMNQHGGSTAANRFDFGGWDYPVFAKCDVDLAYDGTLSRWVVNDPHPFVIPSINVGQYFFSDRENMAGADGLFAAPTAASGGTATGIAGEAGHPGLTRLTLGTSATGSASVLANDIASIVVGNSIYTRFDAIIRINALSNATDRFTLRVGLIDSGTAESTDGVFFRYVDNVNSGNWVLVARSNGTETVGNSTVAAATGFTKLTCVIYPAGNKADFFVNDTFVAASSSVTSNFPTGAGRNTAPGIMFLKSAGTTNNTGIDFDAYQLIQYHNVSR